MYMVMGVWSLGLSDSGFNCSIASWTSLTNTSHETWMRFSTIHFVMMAHIIRKCQHVQGMVFSLCIITCNHNWVMEMESNSLLHQIGFKILCEKDEKNQKF